ncbi:hypothetical protein B0H10DRAFT_2224647 [Mycena sp. CBHHK59/15]|nr:hypothetical protein B0H10DRAFT_2224647 [Mycena sp. CBHHK59/15]
MPTATMWCVADVLAFLRVESRFRYSSLRAHSFTQRYNSPNASAPPQRARTNGTTTSQLALLPLPRLPPAAIRRMRIASIGSTPVSPPCTASSKRLTVHHPLSPVSRIGSARALLGELSPHRSAPRMLPLVAAPARESAGVARLVPSLRARESCSVRRALVAGAQEMDSAHAVEHKPARLGATPRYVLSPYVCLQLAASPPHLGAHRLHPARRSRTAQDDCTQFRPRARRRGPGDGADAMCEAEASGRAETS